MIAPLASCKVNIFTDFNVSIGAKNDDSVISPTLKSIGSEPVYTQVSRAPIACHHSIAKILKGRVLRVMDVTSLGCYNFSTGRSGIKKVLIKLMGADVVDNATVTFDIKKPVGASLGVHAVRG